MLTGEQIEKVFDELCDTDHCSEMFDYLFARAIEKLVREATLEEAAKVCDEERALRLGEKLRALKWEPT